MCNEAKEIPQILQIMSLPLGSETENVSVMFCSAVLCCYCVHMLNPTMIRTSQAGLEASVTPQQPHARQDGLPDRNHKTRVQGTEI